MNYQNACSNIIIIILHLIISLHLVPALSCWPRIYTAESVKQQSNVRLSVRPSLSPVFPTDAVMINLQCSNAASVYVRPFCLTVDALVLCLNFAFMLLLAMLVLNEDIDDDGDYDDDDN